MKISLATQLLISHETNVTNTVDPLAGSYYIESLTDSMEESARKYIDKIDEMGNGSMVKGMLKAIETGYLETEITDSAFQYATDIEQGVTMPLQGGKTKTDGSGWKLGAKVTGACALLTVLVIRV